MCELSVLTNRAAEPRTIISVVIKHMSFYAAFTELGSIF